jgi:hypothetical protein
MNNVKLLIVRIGGAGVIKTFEGRFAWTLLSLIEAGERGITTLKNPAPRLSHYIFVLRREGVAIETVKEYHGGPYRGCHGRYVLRCTVQVLERRDAS